jgi:hypothetical protein
MDCPALRRHSGGAGAQIVEFVAKSHYERARNFAVPGVEQEDQYRCPEGEHLKLLKLDHENRLAVYQISTSCQSCRLKESCTPHSQARQVTRSLATWAEAEVGKFPGASARLCFSRLRSSAPFAYCYGLASPARAFS